MMMATDWPTLFPDCPSGLVRGGLAVSGLFDLEPIRLSFLNESLSLDAQSVAANSPVHLKKRNRGPLRLVYGSLEGEEYSRQSKTLAEAWPETDVEAMDGHDHFSIMREMDRPNGALARMAVEVTESVSPA